MFASLLIFICWMSCWSDILLFLVFRLFGFQIDVYGLGSDNYAIQSRSIGDFYLLDELLE